jgi:hypothetical protein
LLPADPSKTSLLQAYRPATDARGRAAAAQHGMFAVQNTIENFKVRNIKYSSIDPAPQAVARCRQHSKIMSVVRLRAAGPTGSMRIRMKMRRQETQ